MALEEVHVRKYFRENKLFLVMAAVVVLLSIAAALFKSIFGLIFVVITAATVGRDIKEKCLQYQLNEMRRRLKELESRG